MEHEVPLNIARRRASVRKYYASHACQIVKRKTLQKVAATGRKVREATLLKNGISREEVEVARSLYLASRETVPTDEV